MQFGSSLEIVEHYSTNYHYSYSFEFGGRYYFGQYFETAEEAKNEAIKQLKKLQNELPGIY